MSSPVISIRAGSTLAMANYKVSGHKIRRLPVVDNTGDLVGLVTQTDLVSAFSDELNKQKDRIEAEIDRRTEYLSYENSRLEASARFRSEFLAHMSHEIRTPMTAILGFAESLLEEELPPEERRSASHTIVASGKHILDLLNEILDLSKLEAGKLDLELIATSPLEILGESRQLMLARASDKGLRLGLESVGRVPIHFETDPTRFRQIMLNLTSDSLLTALDEHLTRLGLNR